MRRIAAPKCDMAVMAVSGDKNELDASAGPTFGRRGSMGAMMGLVASGMLSPNGAQAVNANRIPLDQYSTSVDFQWRGQPHGGLKYYDLQEGKGAPLVPGENRKVTVHFDCKFKAIVAVSSRSAVTLAQNRTIEKPLTINYGSLPVQFQVPEPTVTVEGTGVQIDTDPIVEGLFVVALARNSPGRESALQINDRVLKVNGEKVFNMNKVQVQKLLTVPKGETVTLTVGRLQGMGEAPIIVETSITAAAYEKLLPQRSAKDYVEVQGGGGGMYSGEDNAPPPNVLFVPAALAGMKKGGVRRLLVDDSGLGYGPDGKNEIPAGKDFFVEVELLD